MDRHTDTRFLARGHDPAQKINEIFKQFFVRNALVRFQQSAEFTLDRVLSQPGKRRLFLSSFISVSWLYERDVEPSGRTCFRSVRSQSNTGMKL